MRSIFYDNLYLFSMSRENFGKIIEYRAEKPILEKLNVFELLGISEDEERFVRDRLCAFSSLPMLAAGRDGAVLFVPDLGYACLAFEFLPSELPAPDVFKVCGNGAFGEILMSPAAAQRCEQEGKLNARVYEYLSELFEESGIRGIATQRYAPIESKEVLRILDAVQFLAGCQITLSVAENRGEGLGGKGETDSRGELARRLYEGRPPELIFSSEYFMTAMLVLLMGARKYAKDKKSTVIIRDADGVFDVEVVFRLRDKNHDRYSFYFIEELAEINGMFCKCLAEQGIVKAHIEPFYSDIGQTGIKAELKLL